MKLKEKLAYINFLFTDLLPKNCYVTYYMQHSGHVVPVGGMRLCL
jgi:hypothetical protein